MTIYYKIERCVDLDSMKWDYEQYVIAYNVEQPDGRIVRTDAFKGCDGDMVPLVYRKRGVEYLRPSYLDPDNVIGFVKLENREEGIFAYYKLFDTVRDKSSILAQLDNYTENVTVHACIYNHNVKEVFDASIKSVTLRST